MTPSGGEAKYLSDHRRILCASCRKKEWKRNKTTNWAYRIGYDSSYSPHLWKRFFAFRISSPISQLGVFWRIVEVIFHLASRNSWPTINYCRAKFQTLPEFLSHSFSIEKGLCWSRNKINIDNRFEFGDLENTLNRWFVHGKNKFFYCNFKFVWFSTISIIFINNAVSFCKIRRGRWW